jgi:TatD DNase family protein
MIDSHAHLNLDSFSGDRNEVIIRATEKGVLAIVNVGIDQRTSIECIELAREQRACYAAVGVHPDHVDPEKGTRWIDSLAECEKVVAIGEIGIDDHHRRTPLKDQCDFFLLQLEKAQKMDLPVIIHVRSAEEIALEVMAHASAPLCGVWHCFSGTEEHLEKALALGLHIGVGGLVTFRNSDRRELLSRIPPERLLLETDSPYLSPHPIRGKRNEPGNLPLILQEVASAWRVSPREAEETTDATASMLFRLSPRERLGDSP